MKNTQDILNRQGLDICDEVKTTVFIKDMNDFVKINEVYNEYLGDVKPARACVEVARLPKDLLIEVEVTAIKDR